MVGLVGMLVDRLVLLTNNTGTYLLLLQSGSLVSPRTRIFLLRHPISQLPHLTLPIYFSDLYDHTRVH